MAETADLSGMIDEATDPAAAFTPPPGDSQPDEKALLAKDLEDMRKRLDDTTEAQAQAHRELRAYRSQAEQLRRQNEALYAQTAAQQQYRQPYNPLPEDFSDERHLENPERDLRHLASAVEADLGEQFTQYIGPLQQQVAIGTQQLGQVLRQQHGTALREVERWYKEQNWPKSELSEEVDETFQIWRGAGQDPQTTLTDAEQLKDHLLSLRRRKGRPTGAIKAATPHPSAGNGQSNANPSKPSLTNRGAALLRSAGMDPGSINLEDPAIRSILSRHPDYLTE